MECRGGEGGMIKIGDIRLHNADATNLLTLFLLYGKIDPSQIELHGAFTFL